MYQINLNDNETVLAMNVDLNPNIQVELGSYEEYLTLMKKFVPENLKMVEVLGPNSHTFIDCELLSSQYSKVFDGESDKHYAYISLSGNTPQSDADEILDILEGRVS